ncbi:MAG: hypothetical protein ACI4EA_01435 [Candidatus Ornithomonoglobus sp.]
MNNNSKRQISEATIENVCIPSLTRKYELALHGANFIVYEQDGIATKNSYLYELYVAKVLAVDYLNLLESNILTDDEYDLFNNRSIVGSLRSFIKNVGDLSLALKAKRIISDFKIFKEMLDVEIENEVNRRNDLFNRLDKQLQINLTPENIENLLKTKDDVITQLEQKKETE